MTPDNTYKLISGEYLKAEVIRSNESHIFIKTVKLSEMGNFELDEDYHKVTRSSFTTLDEWVHDNFFGELDTLKYYNIDKPIKVNTRKAAYADLSLFCSFSMGNNAKRGDFLEVTRWTNGEGYDVYISYGNQYRNDQQFSLSEGQMEALIACYKQLNSIVA